MEAFNYGHCEKYLTTAGGLKETIDKYGVAIIHQVISDQECEEMLTGIWNYFEHLTQKWDKPLDRNNRDTWREFYKLMPLHSMLVQFFGVGHAQISWNLRQNPKIVNIFATLWNVTPEELLVSFDGLSFNFPPEITNKGYFRPKKCTELAGTELEQNGISWLHSDQSYVDSNFQCVQSWITALDVNSDDATLLLLEGSNKYHEEFAQRYQITDKDDWYKLTESEVKFYVKDKECFPVRITCSKGSMVFWDSRTIHCGCEAIKGRADPKFRAVIYLCYLPRKGTSEANLRKKKKAFEESRTTKHNPQKSLLFGKFPRSYGEPIPEVTVINKPILTDLGLKLAGY